MTQNNPWAKNVDARDAAQMNEELSMYQTLENLRKAISEAMDTVLSADRSVRREGLNEVITLMTSALFYLAFSSGLSKEHFIALLNALYDEDKRIYDKLFPNG